MTILELIELTKARINYINVLKISAVATGDIAQITILENELSVTTNTLNSLLTINQ